MAVDSDGDGLSDFEEGSRVRSVPFGWRQKIADQTVAHELVSIFASDLDGDGDPDVLSASWYDDKIAWYENQLDEASADFGTQQVITAAADGASSVFAADLDGDGDPDVVSASSDDDKVAWYENRLDQPSADFGPQQAITRAADGAFAVFAADLDGDGDLDVLSASYRDDKIAWYENRNGKGNFSTELVISTAADGASSVFAADLDGDGDPDVLSASMDDNKIAWYENRLDQPSADFGPQQAITTAAHGALAVFAADLDGDGAPDVLSASYRDDKIAWYENRLDEASADFGPEQVITTEAGWVVSVFATDFDGDGDPDVLSGARGYGQKIVWSENRLDEASADFGPQQVLDWSGYGRSVFAADLDGDGDEDALSAGGHGNLACCSILMWFENPGTDPFDPDSDDDGLSDGDEVNVYATDPNDTESDGDGLFDGDEVMVYGTDPADPDTDGDGLKDGDEVMVYGTDPNDADSDGDGLLDSFELANGFDPLVGGEETQDPDLDGLDNLGEQAAGTDPFNPDGDDDRLLDGEEVNLHGTDPADPDSDDDGFFDDVEVFAGTDPNDPNDHPDRGARLPMLYKASLELHVRGTRECYWGNCVINYLRRPLGGPLVGSGTTNVTLKPTGSLLDLTIKAGGLHVQTASISGTLPPVQNSYASVQVRTHPNASFANDSGFFYPGGGPGSHNFGYYRHTFMSGSADDPIWSIAPGTNQFGGSMRLLGAIAEARNLRVYGTPTLNFYAHAADPFSALGGRCTATKGCPSSPVSQASRTVRYYTSLMSLYTTALVKSWGYAWTTGTVYVRGAFANAYPSTQFMHSGYDNRTALGQGIIQLVAPRVAHWDFAGLPLDRTTGAIGILNIEIRFAPEPSAWLLLAAGLGCLVALRRVGRRVT